MADEPIDLELALREAADLTEAEVTELLEEHVRNGLMEHAGFNAQGERLYKMTPEGDRRARELIEGMIGPSD